MAGRERTQTALEREWRARGIVEDTLVPDSRGTIARPDASLVEATVASDALHALPAGEDRRRPFVVLGDVIGEGGMGTVRLATQPALRRQVAVKELKDDAPLEAVAALVREAWVAGNLEHPNIVPIHALTGSQGAPQLVMKRIEGTDWSELLHDPAAWRPFGVDAPFERNLEVLGQIARAVHFAHSKGVLHLDLKPENVMLGRFGEVYLLDWGVAVSLRDDAPEWMPRAAEVRTVCGTPAYMAPEMAAGDGAGFDARTDVYLLGAILHEIVTGRPPHDGENVVDKLVSAYASAPVAYPPDVPPGLAAIGNRAMARDPDDRFPDAEAFRVALFDFRAHRSSIHILRAATERLARIQASAAPDAAPADRLDEAELQREYAACRFGLEQAAHEWPDNPAVPDALQALFEGMAAHALRDRRPEQVEAWLAQLSRPAPAIAERLAALRQEVARERAHHQELERLHEQEDLNLHRRARATMSVLVGVLWLVWNVGGGALFRHGVLPLDHPTVIAGGLVTVLLFTVGAWLFRRSVLRTEVNRRGLVLMAVGFVGVVALWVGCWRFGVPPLESVGLSYLFYVQYPIALGLLVDRRVLGPGLATVPLSVAALVWPAWTFELLGATGALFGLSFAWIWWQPRFDTLAPEI